MGICSVRLALYLLTLTGCIRPLLAQDFRLVRSISGPSGKVRGSAFIFDETRSRFVYPQDKSFIVYFEWSAQPGTYALTALWHRPDGQVNSISPEVKIDAPANDLACYWTYLLQPDMAPGVWSVEIRVDGRPAGSHSFEIAGTSEPPTAPPPVDKPPTLDEIFGTVSPSLVWVRKRNSTGRPVDTGSGFVIDKDRVLTAFQMIDGAGEVEIQFTGGRKVLTRTLLASSRQEDWAVLSVSTGDVPALTMSDPREIQVGARLIVFSAEADTRTIGGVDISGRRELGSLGTRIQFSPALSLESAGGPLLNMKGQVLAVLGGSVVPGSRFNPRNMSVSPRLSLANTNVTAATRIPALSLIRSDHTSTLSDLIASGELTAPLSEIEELIYVTTASEVNRNPGAPLPRDVCDFSRRDKQVWVVSEWQKKGKASKGMLSAKVYDTENRPVVTVEPRKISLDVLPARASFGFAPTQVQPGIYRIDLIWDGQAVWRTFVRITD
jgi:S1-C subfamily serine protease